MSDFYGDHHHYQHHHRHRRRPWRWIVAGLLTAIVVVGFGSAIWYMLETQPASSQAALPVSFQLTSGTSLPTLASQLQQKKIIRNATAFTIYVVAKGVRHSLEAGNYQLNPHDQLATIVNVLANGQIAKYTLVVPEGFTIAKIRALAVQKGISAQAFNAALAATYTNSFLSGRPSGDTSLEGYLFPDSYQIEQPPNAGALIQAMLDDFGQKVTQAGLAQAYAAEGLTLHQGVTLASIVQQEAGNPKDQPIIAQVFLKRIQLGMPLQSDVTVNYASELTGLPFSVTLNSPYNTYAHTGLPPGPIASPGLSAMEAVAHPADTDYLYFLADKNGVVHYAQTAQQHEANVQQYLDQ
ncbi:MAG TPA: endolytic transglycosylase MltG [Candidatus Saccharimonadales bacterium]|nr:endolytic transglycosylase MltG [Candidatus Saccharimonadales bacterium]